MRLRLVVSLCLLVAWGAALEAKEVFLPVSGTANGIFFSDARIFNPADHEITIQAYYLPRGNASNAGEQPVAFSVPARQMKIFDDIVATLLHRGDVGGIRFVAAEDFVVTQRSSGSSSCPRAVNTLTTAPCTSAAGTCSDTSA